MLQHTASGCFLSKPNTFFIPRWLVTTRRWCGLPTRLHGSALYGQNQPLWRQALREWWCLWKPTDHRHFVTVPSATMVISAKPNGDQRIRHQYYRHGSRGNWPAEETCYRWSHLPALHCSQDVVRSKWWVPGSGRATGDDPECQRTSRVRVFVSEEARRDSSGWEQLMKAMKDSGCMWMKTVSPTPTGLGVSPTPMLETRSALVCGLFVKSILVEGGMTMSAQSHSPLFVNLTSSSQ